ncbi:MAG: hypothetical protein HFG67_01505 [Firmicutes bacterium]|nr:hypothetical protein [Bacillota bacterium]
MKRNMKWIICILALILIFSAAACTQKMGTEGNGDSEENGGAVLEIENEALVDFYFGIIKDLYEEDHGLNDGIEIIAVDLSNVTNLNDDEKTALIEKIAAEYSIEAKESTYQELVSEGAISNPDEFPSYDNGLLFDFENFEADENTIKFTAGKWRTALGAYFFSDCEAIKSEDGTWTYTVGAHAIS